MISPYDIYVPGKYHEALLFVWFQWNAPTPNKLYLLVLHVRITKFTVPLLIPLVPEFTLHIALAKASFMTQYEDLARTCTWSLGLYFPLQGCEFFCLKYLCPGVLWIFQCWLFEWCFDGCRCLLSGASMQRISVHAVAYYIWAILCWHKTDMRLLLRWLSFLFLTSGSPSLLWDLPNLSQYFINNPVRLLPPAHFHRIQSGDFLFFFSDSNVWRYLRSRQRVELHIPKCFGRLVAMILFSLAGQQRLEEFV